MHILSTKTFCLLLTFVCQFTVIVAGPDTLRITGSSYFDESKTLVLSNYISSQLKVPVKYENIPSTKRMHEALRSGKVDLALMNTFQYVFAKSDRINNIQPFMILGDSSGKAKTYLSCLIVRPNSPYKSLNQVVIESSKIRLDFAYVASTSGHIVPRMELANLGMQYPEAQFGNVNFSGGHLEAIKAVIENRSDAAFVAVDDLVNYQLQGLISKDAVKIIWTSYPIMQSPVVIRQDLPETVKQKLRVLFLNLHINNPGVWNHIQKNWGALRPARFVEAYPDDFLSVQKAADKVGKLVYFLNYYEERIAQQAQQLTNGEKLIEGQNVKIQEQKKVLEQQILQIKTQTVSLYLLGLLVMGIAGIIVVIIKASRSKQRLNEQLTGKNNQLEQTLFDLKVTQDKLVHSEKMASLGLLTAGIAHEINNPVNFIFTGINGLEKNINALLTVVEELEKLEDIPADDAQHQRETVALVKQQKRYVIVKASLSEFIDGIRLGAKRTADIVSGLRNFARTDQSERTMAHVHDCLNSALILLNFKIKEANIQVVKDYDASIPEMACYPGPLNQVFMNLFTNAMHAIQARTDLEGGQIKIETKKLAQTVEITISDNGIGIVKDIRDKIFDPFFTTKDVREGTGLGLSITYGIIQKHQGSIEVESNVGSGTTFLIQLPTNLTMAY